MNEPKSDLFPTAEEMFATMLFCIAKTGEFIKDTIETKIKE
jgi:hypothetical protein